jgi:hypothetical protein
MRLCLGIAMGVLLAVSGMAALTGGTGHVAAADPAGPSVVPQPLTADQLAGMLNVTAWSFQYKDCVAQCWVEIEEVGGKHPRTWRMPDAGYVPMSTPQAREGTILLWWQRPPGGQGGAITLDVNGSRCVVGLAEGAFVWGFKAWSASVTPNGKQPAFSAAPGEELVLVNFDAKESVPEGSEEAAREVHLKLKAKFTDRKN